MNFRDRMKVKSSRAEYQVFCELQKRGLCTYLNTNKGFRFNKEDKVKGTVPDFYWSDPIRYAVYLDGFKVHRKKEEKDQLIKEALERRHIRVDRFTYHTPLRKYRLTEICDRVEATIKLIMEGEVSDNLINPLME